MRQRCVNLDLSATSAALWIVLHLLVKLKQGVLFRSSTDIEHQAEFWLDEFADALEKPFMRVNLAVVSVLDGKHEVNSSCLQDVRIEAEVPRGNLKYME